MGGGACGESPDPSTVGGCVMAGEYEPAARYAHVAAAVEDKVYVWGGLRSGFVFTEVSHDGPDKTAIIFKVDILDVKVRNTLILVVSDSTPLDDSWLIK